MGPVLRCRQTQRIKAPGKLCDELARTSAETSSFKPPPSERRRAVSQAAQTKMPPATSQHNTRFASNYKRLYGDTYSDTHIGHTSHPPLEPRQGESLSGQIRFDQSPHH